MPACGLSLQSCLTLCDRMDYCPPGSSVHGVLQARILEWVAMPSSRWSSCPRGGTCISCVPCIARRFFTAEPPGKALTVMCKQHTNSWYNRPARQDPKAPMPRRTILRAEKPAAKPVGQPSHSAGGCWWEVGVVWGCVWMQALSRSVVFATPWTVTHQAPLSIGFSR